MSKSLPIAVKTYILSSEMLVMLVLHLQQCPHQDRAKLRKQTQGLVSQEDEVMDDST